MKKLVIMFLLLGVCGFANAESLKLSEILEKFPLKQGVAWSLVDDELNYLSTVEVAKWKILSLELGYAGAAENTGHKAIAVLSTSLLNAKKLGIDVPILNLIDLNVGLYAGYGSINGQALGDSELDAGVSATLLSIKW